MLTRRRAGLQLLRRRANLSRTREILAVFARNGFGLLIDQLGLFRYVRLRRKDHARGVSASDADTGATLQGPRLTAGQRLRQSLETLGPTFIKLGQILSTRPEIFPPDVINELKKLQDAAPPFPFADVQAIIEADFGEPIDRVFREFETVLRQELDFTREGDNLDVFRQNLEKDPGITVPEVKWVYTSPRVLTMSYIEGVRIDDLPALTEAGLNREKLATVLTTSVINQILRDGLFHADPHPGNILVQPDGTIVLLDVGMVGRLGESRKRMIADFFIGVTTHDSKLAVKAITELEVMPDKSNLRRFERDVDRIIDKYLTMAWQDIQITELLNDVFTSARVNRIRVPREFALIAKTLGTLQGLLEVIAPEMNTLTVARPIARRLMFRSFSFDRFGDELRKSLWSYKDLLTELPVALRSLLAKIEDQEFSVGLEVKDIDRIQRKLDSTLDRVAFSVVLLAISIIIAGIIVGSSISVGADSEVFLLNEAVLKASLILAAILIIGLVYSLLRTSRK
jgi:ubiquinone biosynthesis protein